ncbi:hypothetical protein [Aureimonas ureilytica]|uniref:hypothetical protein n=1 Tax=Aureimonas ureilytica TaxID=401562 RepID=UPI0012DBFD0F|nr:hypothetical protein [Aureimonas ureilytica]
MELASRLAKVDQHAQANLKKETRCGDTVRTTRDRQGRDRKGTGHAPRFDGDETFLKSSKPAIGFSDERCVGRHDTSTTHRNIEVPPSLSSDFA